MKILGDDKVRVLRFAAQFLPAMIPLFFSLYFWKKGWVEPAITFMLLGIGLILLGGFLILVKRIIGNDRYFVIIGGVLLVLIGLYCWIGSGNIYAGIFAVLVGMAVILGEILKEKRWQIGITIALVLAVGTIIYLEETGEDRPRAIDSGAGVEQEVVDKAPEPNSVPSDEPSGSASFGQSMTDMMNRFLTPEQRENPTFQKVMKIVESDSFQKQMQEQDLRTPQEFIDLMAAHGLTEFSGIDYDKVMTDAYALATQEYQAANPGKNPEDEDETMAKRIGEMLKTADSVYGIVEIVQDQEIALWVAARFQGDQAALSEWLMPLMKGSVSAGSAISSSAPTDFAFPDGFLSDSPSDVPAEQPPFVESEPPLSDPIPTSTREESTIPNAENSSAAAPTVEPEKILTEVSPEPLALPTEEVLETALRERFSPERFERAMSTLERYGPEEGLRRLRDADPEIAKQVEWHRNRESRTEDSQ